MASHEELGATTVDEMDDCITEVYCTYPSSARVPVCVVCTPRAHGQQARFVSPASQQDDCRMQNWWAVANIALQGSMRRDPPLPCNPCLCTPVLVLRPLTIVLRWQLCGFKSAGTGGAGSMSEDRVRSAAMEQALNDVAAITNSAASQCVSPHLRLCFFWN